MTHPWQQKKELRKQIAQAKQAIMPADWAKRSVLLANNVYRVIAGRPVQQVGLFLSLPDEWDTAPLIALLEREGYVIAVPKVEGEDINFYPYNPAKLACCGAYGIQEPIALPTERVVPHLLVVPGVAFSPEGYRLGRGKGYYDRYIAQHKGIYCVGTCFKEQLLANVPSEEHDQCMDVVVTDQLL